MSFADVFLSPHPLPSLLFLSLSLCTCLDKQTWEDIARRQPSEARQIVCTRNQISQKPSLRFPASGTKLNVTVEATTVYSILYYHPELSQAMSGNILSIKWHQRQYMQNTIKTLQLKDTSLQSLDLAALHYFKFFSKEIYCCYLGTQFKQY